MHIYILLTAEGYQRSFPAIWGWHWYRSYLRPQIVTWDPFFCWGFLCLCPMGLCVACIGCTEVYFLPSSITFTVNFTFICKKRIAPRVCVCMCGYQAILVTLLVLRITGICAHTADTKAHSVLFACVHQVMLKGPDHFEQLTNYFCQYVTNSTSKNPGIAVEKRCALIICIRHTHLYKSSSHSLSGYSLPNHQMNGNLPLSWLLWPCADVGSG